MDSFDDVAYEPVVSGGGVFWPLLVVILLAAAVALFFIYRSWYLNRRRSLLNMRGLKVILPRAVEEEQTRMRDPRELTAIMEPVFASLQHFYTEHFHHRLWHGQPTFSFELVVKNGEIFFYIIGQKDFLAAVEQQVHAQYPAAQIEQVKDYQILDDAGGFTSIAALGFIRQRIFPIRTYKTLENDPLNAVTNSLSKVAQGRAAIQILVCPTEQHWQQGIEEALHNVQQGKRLNVRESFGQKAMYLAREVGKSAVLNQQEEMTHNEGMNTARGNVRLTAMQEQQAKMLVEKGSKLGFRTQIRVVAKDENPAQAKTQVQSMLSAFSQFQSPEANGFKTSNIDDTRLLSAYRSRTFSRHQPTLLLNTEELTSIFHFPNRKLETPNIHWLGARKLAPPTNLPQSGVLLGYSHFRGQQIPIYTQYHDRMRHLYMIGKTGVGKTVLFQNMILQDIRNGHGACFIDPNGDAIEWILRHIPKERAEDVILLDPSDTARPLALNLLEYDPNHPEQKTMVINEMISIFDKLYDLRQTGGPIFEQYMRNAMLLIMEDPESGSTLMEIPKVLADEKFRKMKLERCKNPVVVDFWVKEAEKAGGEAALQNIVPYITSKLTQFTSNDIMRPIIGQQKSAFSFREAMDSKKIILVTLPKGLLGDMNAQLLGMIISGKIQIAAFSRQNIAENERVPFFLYVDEFQNFTSKTFMTILSEARKYALSLNITNQYIAQLDEEMRSAVMGNVGTTLAWRVGAADAEFLQKEFDPLKIEDMVNTEKFNFYIKLLIDGTPSRPFNAIGYPPDPHDNKEIGEAVRQLSRMKYGRDRETVEAEIRLRTKIVV